MTEMSSADPSTSPSCLLSPPCVCCSQATNVELTLDTSCSYSAPWRLWLAGCAEQNETPATASQSSCAGTARVGLTAACQEGSGPHQHVVIRAQLRPQTPGVFSLVACPPLRDSLRDQQQEQPTLLAGAATAPLLVAPNQGVQQEMAAVFATMQSVVHQQQQQQQDDSGEAAASTLTWCLHYSQLLWDMQSVLDCTAAAPGCLPAEVAAGVFTGVLEFLGHHGCWCTISWLLAQATRGRLLKHAKAAATQRLQETQPFAWLGRGAEATSAMCAGFIVDLARSSWSPPGGSSRCGGAGGGLGSTTAAASPQPERRQISSTRRALNAIRAAAVGAGQRSVQHVKQAASSNSSSSAPYHSTAADADDADAASCNGSSVGGKGSSGSSSSLKSSAKLSSNGSSSGSSCLFEDAVTGSPQQQQHMQTEGQAAAAGRCSWCHAWWNHLVLAVAAIALGLLLLALSTRQLRPCQAAAGHGLQRQLAGCVPSFQPLTVASVLRPYADKAGAFVGLLLLNSPFLVLLLAAASAASRVCIVL